ncbi:hypothetical protein pb186bvf_013282 [Paramecium bursaria]
MEVTKESLQEGAQNAKRLVSEGKYNEAEVIISNVMRQALDFYNDSMAYELAEYYYFYGCVLVQKITATQDVFGQRVRDAENQALGQEEEEEDSDGTVDGSNFEEHKIDDIQQPAQAQDEEDEDDFKVAWESLEVAWTIIDKRVEQNIATVDDLKKLAKIATVLAELVQWEDKFDQAQEYYGKALKLRLQTEDVNNSRELAELYFLMGITTLNQAMEGKEQEALDSFYKSAQILENCLCSRLNTPVFEVVPQEKYERNHLVMQENDAEDIKELKDVIQQLYLKIEDVQENKKLIQSEEYKKLKEEVINIQKQKEEQTTFNKVSDQNIPVQQLGVFGNAAKKQSAPQNAPQIIQQTAPINAPLNAPQTGFQQSNQGQENPIRDIFGLQSLKQNQNVPPPQVSTLNSQPDKQPESQNGPLKQVREIDDKQFDISYLIQKKPKLD